MQRLNTVLMPGNMAYHVTQSNENEWIFIKICEENDALLSRSRYCNVWHAYNNHKCKPYATESKEENPKDSKPTDQPASQPASHLVSHSNGILGRKLTIRSKEIFISLHIFFSAAHFYVSLLSESRIYGKRSFHRFQELISFAMTIERVKMRRAITLNGFNSAQ